MSCFHYNDTVKVKRLPFADKTNFLLTDVSASVTFNRASSNKSKIEALTSVHAKLKLIAKVHLKSCDIINKEFLSTPDNLQSQEVTTEQIISSDAKFKLNPKVHVQREQIIANDPKFKQIPKVHVQREQIILNDPKFKLILKVHVLRLSIEDKMPNLPSTNCMSHNNGIVSKTSTNFTKKSKLEEGANHKCVPGIEINIPVSEGTKNESSSLDSKFYQKLVVNINRSKELEEALKFNSQPPKVVKKVHFMPDINMIPKFDKALRKRRTKNYAELSISDAPSPAGNLEGSYRDHVPVYLQNTTIQKQRKGKDPFEFVSDSLSKDPKKKKHKGRSVKKIHSPLQSKKKRRGKLLKEESSDSDSSVYDMSMHEILNRIRRNLSRKKYKNVKQNNVKIITNQIKNVQIAPSDNGIKNNITNSNRNKNGLVVSNTKVKAGPSNVQKYVARSGVQNFEEFEIVTIGGNQTVSSKDVANRSTLTLLTREIQNISRTISTASNQNIEKQKTDDCDRYFGFDDDYEDDVNDISLVLPAKQGPSRKTLDSIKPISVLQKFTLLTSTPLPNIQRRSLKPTEAKNHADPKRINIISDILVSSSRNTKSPKHPNVAKIAVPSVGETSTVDTSSAASLLDNSNDFLGFDNSHAGPSTSAGLHPVTLIQNSETSKLDVVDSVKHQTKVTENDFRGFVTASNRLANVNTRKRRTSYPWRVDRLKIRRNPHFLTIKDTSLPCYNQEMILDAKLLERSKTPVHNEETKSNKVQKSMLDFVTSNKINNESTPTKKNHNTTLFDADDFSPIRNKSSDENSSPNKNSEDENNEKLKTPKGKRNIFKVRRKKNEISPLRQRNREFGLENYFGFDSPGNRHTAGKENVRLARNRSKRENNIKEDALPMRVPMKQLRKVREEIVQELFNENNLEREIVEEPEVQEIVEDALPNEKSQDEDVLTVGLFEDLAEMKPPPRIYGRKRTKRTRAVSISSDAVEEEKPKRKRKDVPTRAEEEEFNRWAATFNAMCNEVEKHNLETD